MGEWNPTEIEALNKLQLLSAKPVIYLVNLSEKDYIRKKNKFLPALATPGDAAAGAKTFTALCAQCHTMGGQGGKVGPTMDGVGARDPKEVLADIVDPNRSVEANYRLWNIETTEDDTISGRLDTETETSVELMDATGQRHVVQRKEIKSMSVSTLSIMPVGLIDPLPPKDVADLMAYLAKSTHK